MAEANPASQPARAHGLAIGSGLVTIRLRRTATASGSCSTSARTRELNDVARENPDKLAKMTSEWDAYARSVGYIEAGEVKQLAGMSPEEFFRFGAASVD